MMMRAFFAIDLPETVKTIIHSIILTLEKNMPANSVRWINPQQPHVTLRFIEKINPADVPELLKKTREVVANFNSFDLELGQLELFPTPNKARIISLKVNPEETLAALSKAIGTAVQATGYPVETRPFRGHLTLGRVDYHRPETFKLPDIEIPAIEKIPIREIVLFQSEPTEGKSYKYALLERISL